MIRTPELKLINDRKNLTDTLFDLRKDPWEMTNVAADSAYKDRLALMKRYMDENDATYNYAPKVKRHIEELVSKGPRQLS